MNIPQQQQISTEQQQIETNVRMALGDLQLQLIMARAKIADLEAEVARLRSTQPDEIPKANGKERSKGEHPA